MEPKEKARELVDKFDLPTGLMSRERKQCALICVDEIIENQYDIVSKGFDDFWQQVKEEINKL